MSNMVYMIGFWKSNQNVTLGLFHYIAPANSHTHILATHALLHYQAYVADWSAILQWVLPTM